MNPNLRFKATRMVPVVLALGFYSRSFADDSETHHQLTLADLASYRAALSGKATAADAKADDLPARVGFKDLWNRPDAFRGRHVTVQGRVERIFRQGPVGSFPPLAEVWITSPAGDPICLVVPQEGRTGILSLTDHGQEDRATSRPIPELGRTIGFTGTFLKLVGYAAKDGTRLAPLVVGNRPLVPISREADGIRSPPADHRATGGGLADNSLDRWAWSPAIWVLVLALAVLAAGVIAWQHLRMPFRRAMVRDSGRNTTTPLACDLPLEFIEPRDCVGSA